ncbi:MAG: hypothetical protein CR217_01410 [Beijerinckiaceae bacterium]|nr:MAG: hypothetical protein CR217_01410 [Beijerinckiaceae bacterium]
MTVTAALREIAKGSKAVTVTIVPVVTAVNELCDAENVFRCENIQFVTTIDRFLRRQHTK